MNIDSMIQGLRKGVLEAKKLQEKTFSQLSTAPSFGNSKYPYKEVAELEFDEQSQSSQQTSILIPEEHGVYFSRVSVYPEARLYTTGGDSNDPSEVTFRPCLQTSTEHCFSRLVEYDPAAMDLRLSFSEVFSTKGRSFSRDIQNGPIPSQLLFSDGQNYRANLIAGGLATEGAPYPSFDHGPGLFFCRPWYMPAGSSISVTVTPTFAGVREDPASFEADPTQKNKYRVKVVLDGFKVVKR